MRHYRAFTALRRVDGIVDADGIELVAVRTPLGSIFRGLWPAVTSPGQPVRWDHVTVDWQSLYCGDRCQQPPVPHDSIRCWRCCECSDRQRVRCRQPFSSQKKNCTVFCVSFLNVFFVPSTHQSGPHEQGDWPMAGQNIAGHSRYRRTYWTSFAVRQHYFILCQNISSFCRTK